MNDDPTYLDGLITGCLMGGVIGMIVGSVLALLT